MSLKILVVEDEEKQRRALARLLARDPSLTEYALEMLEAADGNEALEVVESASPDLVITDLLLPKLDGFKLVARLHQRERRIPVLVVTGVYRQARHAAELRRAYNVELLTKPLDPKLVAKKVRTLLDEYARANPDCLDLWHRPPPKARAMASAAVVDSEPAAAAAAGSPPPAGADTAAEPAASPAAPPPAAADAVIPAQAPAATPAATASPAAAPPATDVASTASVGEATAPITSSTQPVASARPAAKSRPNEVFGPRGSGSLSDLPLAVLLVRAAAAESTGRLRLTRRKVCKVVFLRGGRPIYVDSNLRNETLGAHLVAQGAIDEGQLAQAIKHARGRSIKLGQALVELEIATQETVADGLQSQTQLKLVGALRWPDGRFEFSAGDDFGQIPNCPTDGVRVTLAAMRRFALADQSRNLEAAPLDQCMVLSELGQRFRGVISDVFGPTLIERCGAGAAVRQATGEGFALADAWVQVRVLCMCELATLTAPTETTRAPWQDGLAAPVFSAVQGEGNAASIADTTPTALAHDADVELNEDFVRRPLTVELPLRELDPTTAARPNPLLQLDDVVAETPQREQALYGLESGVVDLSDLGAASAGGQPPTGLPQETVAENDRLALLRRAHQAAVEQSHYELLGVAPGASTAEVEQAASTKQQQFSEAAFEDVELGEDEDKLAELSFSIDQAAAVLLDRVRRQSYDARLLAHSESSDAASMEGFTAELLFQDGQQYLRKGEFAAAVDTFEQAVRGRPSEPDYKAFLGWALFMRHGRGQKGAAAARQHLVSALEMAPESAQVRELCALVERDVGQYGAAAKHLVSALRQAPSRLDLFQKLREALLALDDVAELERQYRDMIFRLRTADPTATLRLWVELAYLYNDRLDRRDQAQLALQVAEKIAPDNELVHAARAVLDDEAAVSLDRAVVGQRARIRENPGSGSALQELFLLHRRAGQDERAFAVAAILIGLEQASPMQRDLYESLRPVGPAADFAPQSSEPLWREAADSRVVGRVLDHLQLALCRHFPLNLRDLGASADEAVSRETLSAPVARALERAERWHGAPLQLQPSEAVDWVYPGPVEQDYLLVGQSFLESEDEGSLAFAVTRASNGLGGARRHAFGRRASELRLGLLAALAVLKEARGAGQVSAELAPLASQIKQHVKDQQQLHSALDELLSTEKQINLSLWIRAVRRSAARAGLLACRDPATALRALPDDEDGRLAVIDLALDDRFTPLS